MTKPKRPILTLKYGLTEYFAAENALRASRQAKIDAMRDEAKDG